MNSKANIEDVLRDDQIKSSERKPSEHTGRKTARTNKKAKKGTGYVYPNFNPDADIEDLLRDDDGTD
jgi:hypothetical protein